MDAVGKTASREDFRFVEGDPVLHTVTKSFKGDTSISLKVGRELVGVQGATVSVIQGLGQIPVEEGDKGCNAIRQKGINELVIPGNAFWIDWVFTATKWNDAGPCNGETVDLCAFDPTLLMVRLLTTF